MAKKTRESKPVVEALTAEEAEVVMAEYAQADARIEEIQAKMDQQITRIREGYADELSRLAQEKADRFAMLQSFAENNRELFQKRKSIEMAHGLLGFRKGTPKLKLLKGYKWPAVVKLLKLHLPTYVRVIEEPAKDKLLADREMPAVLQSFPVCGIKVDADEAFFVDLKKEEFLNT
jgi:phage host-nuclease inhibitor protein Gam